LDGKIFTNITEVAKYPNLVVFTYNESRTSVAISNLPAEFRVKHGVKETESAPQAVPLQTNSTDMIYPLIATKFGGAERYSRGYGQPRHLALVDYAINCTRRSIEQLHIL